jgi:hypothetical protein
LGQCKDLSNGLGFCVSLLQSGRPSSRCLWASNAVFVAIIFCLQTSKWSQYIHALAQIVTRVYFYLFVCQNWVIITVLQALEELCCNTYYPSQLDFISTVGTSRESSSWVHIEPCKHMREFYSLGQRTSMGVIYPEGN